MNNYSQADMAFKKLIDSMKQNGSVFTSADAMVEEFNNILTQHGADDEDLVCIPLSRYEELLRSESEIDILCTLVESPNVESKTALAALEGVADMRDKRLNDCEDDDLPCEESDHPRKERGDLNGYGISYYEQHYQCRESQRSGCVPCSAALQRGPHQVYLLWPPHIGQHGFAGCVSERG